MDAPRFLPVPKELQGPRESAPLKADEPGRLGCVSFLNARPLIEGLDEPEPFNRFGHPPRPDVYFDVPSRLLALLEAGEVDAALCPVIDYQKSHAPLRVLPVGAIGCDGPTLTVGLYSRVPLPRIRTVHADTDSHTSVALLRVLLAELHGNRPSLRAYHAPSRPTGHRSSQDPEALLLIGDKVVTAGPDAVEYPYRMDLGQAWKRLTGLPFVFATWLCPAEPSPAQARCLDRLARTLAAQRRINAGRIPRIVARHAAARGWPELLAQHYLGSLLKYDVGPPQLRAMQRFWDLAHRHGLTHHRRPLRLFETSPTTGPPPRTPSALPIG